MPLYEFLCPHCSSGEVDRYYEVNVPLDQLDREIKCPECDTILIRKNFNAVPFKI